MKHIFIFLFLFISILGCKKNDESWTAVNNGLPNNWNEAWQSSLVNTMATQGNNVYAGIIVSDDALTFEDGVYLSSNHGNSWTAVNYGLPHGMMVTTIAIQGNNIYAGMRRKGVYLSSDNGSTWKATNNMLIDTSVWAIAIQENN